MTLTGTTNTVASPATNNVASSATSTVESPTTSRRAGTAAPSPGAAAPVPHLHAADVIEAAGSDEAVTGDPSARYLLRMVRLCFGTAANGQAALQRVLDELHSDWSSLPVPAPEDMPTTGRRLYRAASSLLNRDLLRDGARSRDMDSWRLAESLRMGDRWLSTAALVAERDAHLLRRPGGRRLQLAAVTGGRLHAQLLPVASAPQGTDPCVEFLRLTWCDTARIVAQSLPGDWARIDLAVNPT